MRQEIYSRKAVDSKDYEQAGKQDLFVSDIIDHGTPPQEDPAYEKIGKFFEDEVIVTIDGIKHVITPKDKDRLKVKVYSEIKVPTPSKPPTLVSIDVARDSTYSPPSQNNAYVSPTDKERIEFSKKLLTVERVTHDPKLWERMEKLNAPRQTVEITLPAGYTFSNYQIGLLEKLINNLASDNLRGAIKDITKIQAKVDKDKIVSDHPKHEEVVPRHDPTITKG